MTSFNKKVHKPKVQGGKSKTTRTLNKSIKVDPNSKFYLLEPIEFELLQKAIINLEVNTDTIALYKGSRCTSSEGGDKIKHHTLESGLRSFRRTVLRDIRANWSIYRCSVCGNYHLGKRPRLNFIDRVRFTIKIGKSFFNKTIN